MLSKKGCRMLLTHRSELIVCSQIVGPTIFIAVMAHHTREEALPNLSLISNSSVPLVPDIDIPTQIEPGFVSKDCKFLVKETAIYSPQEPGTNMDSSLVIAVFNCMNMSNFTRQQT
jgi:hypothetical protein